MKIQKRLTLAALLFAPVAALAEGGSGVVPDITAGWNHLWKELMIDITVIGVIFALITIYLLIKYRRRRSDEEGKGVKLTQLASVGWVFIPAFIFMADDIFLAAKNFELWNKMREVPEGAYEVKVEGYMWGWDITYPEGATATNELRVPVGKAIKVNISSRDVLHSFFIPDYRNTYLWFSANEAGEHVMTCAEYCGTMHSGMYGKVIVMPEAEFQEWLKANTPDKKA